MTLSLAFADRLQDRIHLRRKVQQHELIIKLLPVDQIAITIAVITITLTKLIRNETGKVNHGEEVALQWACSWLDPKHPSESIGLSIQVHTRG